MKVSDDGRFLTASLSGTYTAEQVETVIQQLALARAKMVPEVPVKHPDPTDETSVLVQDAPYFGVAVHRTGKLYVWARNAGLGWLLFRVPAANVPGIRDHLVANVRGGEGGVHSVGDDGSGRSH